MSLQYLRNVSLIVADPAGQGVQLGALRCVFEVKRGDIETPNSCDVRVYNLSQTTANQLRATKGSVPEFTQLQLAVSYGNQPLAQIFWGGITQVRLGREDQRNSYVDITAADGDEPYNFAPTAFTLAAGAQPLTPIQKILAFMGNYVSDNPQTADSAGQPIGLGYVPNSIKGNTNRTIRGRTYYGGCKYELRALAEHNDCRWSIQDGQVTFIPKTAYIPEAPAVISPDTGLIGVPEQTQNGLKLRVLLNPTLRIGRTVKLISNAVNQLRYGLDINSLATNPTLQLGATKLNADGLYYVMRAEHSGDSRGAPWYTDLTCLAVDATYPPDQVLNAVVAPNIVPRF